MRVLYCDPAVPAASSNAEAVSFDDLLEASDIVSIHAPPNGQTLRMINAQTMARMKRGAFLINTSRGAIVDEGDLFQALRSGQIAGAGLDVLTAEPPPKSHPLFSLPNVVFTPHAGSDTFGTFRKVFDSAVTDILHFLRGQRPPNAANWAPR